MTPMTMRRLMLELELEEGALPHGRVIDLGGGELKFTGWIQLAAAIERARVSAQADWEGDTRAAPSPWSAARARSRTEDPPVG